MNATTHPSSGPSRGNDFRATGRPPLKKRPTAFNETNVQSMSSSSNGPMKDVSQARARRLEQNRRAAVESRRRKKVMLEELRRSVAFYTKANSNLKMQNEDLERKIFIAKQRIAQPQMSADETSPVAESKKSVAGIEMNGPCSSKCVAVSMSDPIDREVNYATEHKHEETKLSPETTGLAMKNFSQPSTSEVYSATPSPYPCLELFKGRGSENNEASDDYISALSQFAMQQAQAANAAAAAAKAALQVVNWHKRQKSAGGVSISEEMPSVDLPPELRGHSTASVGVADIRRNENPTD